jgi:hypothetical protein
MPQAKNMNPDLESLTHEQLTQISGGIALGRSGFHATTMLEVLSVLSGQRGSVMVVVDGVIMNKDELGMI